MKMDNVCAIATPYGTGAISIIRASGPDAIELVNKLFKGKDLTKVNSHTINYGHIVDDKGIIDEVLCNVYIAPNSFDGENMVEINCHGGVYVTNRILSLLLKNGFRLAERGEFSKRAFLNHKLDLTRAEAIMDIIASNNDVALRSSNNALRKSTEKLIKTYRDEILDILAKIEVNIDYPEYEDSVDVTHDYLRPILLELLNRMKQILDNSKISTIAIHGVKTAIIGKPNVGKSSLLNMLLDEDKAIVSDIPGTTRDLVEGVLSIGNVTLNLIDTAGIRESSDYVEAIGIKRSQKAIDEADLILLVLDSSKPLDDMDKELIKLTDNKPRITILNKTDLNEAFTIDGAIKISALKGQGMDILTSKISEITSVDKVLSMNGNYLNNARQTDLMSKAYDAITDAYNACLVLTDISLIEIDIKRAFDMLGEITGDLYPEELIDALFTKFCLGK